MNRLPILLACVLMLLALLAAVGVRAQDDAEYEKFIQSASESFLKARRR